MTEYKCPKCGFKFEVTDGCQRFRVPIHYHKRAEYSIELTAGGHQKIEVELWCPWSGAEAYRTI